MSEPKEESFVKTLADLVEELRMLRAELKEYNAKRPDLGLAEKPADVPQSPALPYWHYWYPWWQAPPHWVYQPTTTITAGSTF